MNVAEHTEAINLKDVEIVHGHVPRAAESAEFTRGVKQIKADGHGKCFVCNATSDLQSHHFLAEWSEADLVDFNLLKWLAEIFDIYGYGAKMKDTPITSVDDIRNQMVLCQPHHTGVNETAGDPTGIHNLVFPFWIAQVNCKKGECPVPQAGETIEQAEKRIGP
jgi:hypothetical protein